MYWSFFFLKIRRPPRSPLFPGAALFRSELEGGRARHERPVEVEEGGAAPAHTLIRTASPCPPPEQIAAQPTPPPDRKSTRLNSSHANISYAVFCLKKKIRHIARPLSSPF